jgi:toxin CptA
MEGNVGAALLEHKYSEEAVRSGLGASRLAAACLAAMALATGALIAATPGAIALRIVLATAVACAALNAIHAIALRRGRRGVRALILRRSREIEVGLDSGRWVHGAVRDGSFVAPWLTIVRWRPAGARFDRSIVILPGMLGAEEFRRLRVMLRWS